MKHSARSEIILTKTSTKRITVTIVGVATSHIRFVFISEETCVVVKINVRSSHGTARPCRRQLLGEPPHTHTHSHTYIQHATHKSCHLAQYFVKYSQNQRDDSCQILSGKYVRLKLSKVA